MELNKIEILIEKHLAAETTLAEENSLREYFSTNNVPPHLQQYKALFSYYKIAKNEEAPNREFHTPKRSFKWISVAASAAILLSIGTFAYFNTEQYNESLGSFTDPEIAFQETQHALDLLSGKVNQGIETVEYVEEYDAAKDRIFNLDY